MGVPRRPKVSTERGVKQVHEGPTKAAAGLHCEEHELVAACSVPLILVRFVRIRPGSSAPVSLGSSRAVCGRPRLDDGNVTPDTRSPLR
jgi:hypothetical protein